MGWRVVRSDGMTDPDSSATDFLVIGSGCAGLTAALRASSGGLSGTNIEKAQTPGRGSARFRRRGLVPAHHPPPAPRLSRHPGKAPPIPHPARATVCPDAKEEAPQSPRATPPPGGHNSEVLLGRPFAAPAPAMLEFVEQNTPLHFALTDEPDPMAEYPGGKRVGRMVSPR